MRAKYLRAGSDAVPGLGTWFNILDGLKITLEIADAYHTRSLLIYSES